MQYRTLGTTGLKISVVGVGTWQFGGEWGKTFEQNEVAEILAAAKDCGINFIDTAECYGDHLSEQLIGGAIEKEREDWVVATKFGHKFHDLFTRDQVTDPQAVVAQLEDSLRALRTDYVDILQFHSLNDEAFDTPGLWEALHKQKELGKVRHLGISIGSNRNIYQTDKAGEVGAEILQVVYNRIDQAPEEEVLPSCRRQNLGVLARVPLASGFLSGKYQPGHKFDHDEVRGRWGGNTDEKARLALEIKENEVPEGVDMAQWALAWCLKHPAITCVIPGCKNVEQTRGNAAAADLDIRQQEHPQAA